MTNDQDITETVETLVSDDISFNEETGKFEISAEMMAAYAALVAEVSLADAAPGERSEPGVRKAVQGVLGLPGKAVVKTGWFIGAQAGKVSAARDRRRRAKLEELRRTTALHLLLDKTADDWGVPTVDKVMDAE